MRDSKFRVGTTQCIVTHSVGRAAGVAEILVMKARNSVGGGRGRGGDELKKQLEGVCKVLESAKILVVEMEEEHFLSFRVSLPYTFDHPLASGL